MTKAIATDKRHLNAAMLMITKSSIKNSSMIEQAIPFELTVTVP